MSKSSKSPCQIELQGWEDRRRGKLLSQEADREHPLPMMLAADNVLFVFQDDKWELLLPPVREERVSHHVSHSLPAGDSGPEKSNRRKAEVILNPSPS